MKVIGIIAEYNPFHNGHAYQIAEIRKQTGADYIVVAMSGDFVQRGTPAIIDKYARAEMALSCGADLVVELPTLWATASAEYFAMAGVTLFEKMGCVDGICFGAETDNLPLLRFIADILIEEPQEYKDALSSYLKLGATFPVARAKAVCDYLLQNPKEHATPITCDENSLSSVMNEPNNILAIEYLKAIKRRGNTLSPYLIRRKGAGYHETTIREESSNFLGDTCDNAINTLPTASATAIRHALSQSDSLADLVDVMPANAHSILTEYLSHSHALWEDDFSSILGYLLLTCEKTSLAEIADSNEDIANRITKNRCYFSSFSDFCRLNKSRDITYTRMSRILLHWLLNIREKDYKYGITLDYIPYLRILGFQRTSSALLSEIKSKASSPLISKLANASELLSTDSFKMLEKDIFAADLYEQLVSQKTKKTTSRSEYTRKIVLL